MRKLKVYGGLLMHGGARRQQRAVIATTSQAKAAEAFGVGLGHFRNFCCETGNAFEIEEAMRRPETVVWIDDEAKWNHHRATQEADVKAARELGKRDGLLKAAAMAEAWAESEDGSSPHAGGHAWRFENGPDALRRLARRLRAEAE